MGRRAPYYRIIFGLAALYNAAFGLWTCIAPGAFFDLFQLRPPLYPSIWSCLGMVVGIYGLAYAYAARHLERAAPFILIGLLGKVLGPIGWALAVHSGEWPARTFTLILFNDLVWWLPFALFLIDGTRTGARIRAAAAPACSLLNAFAALAMLAVLRPGTEIVPDPSDRIAYIVAHPVLWRAGWGVWIPAALSLVAFYAWWGARLPPSRWGLAAFVVAAAGLCCDLLAESLFIGWLPDGIDRVQAAGSLLTGGAANGLYTAAGVLLTLQTRTLHGWLFAWTWAVWLAGAALTLTAAASSVVGMVVSTSALMTLFCPWVWAMGRALR